MPPLTLMLKPASSLCNLNCSYCFYKDVASNRQQASYGFMSTDTLHNILNKAFSYTTDFIAIAFQGGEPTLIGLDFFETVTTLVQKYNITGLPVHYSIQTNGYKLNKVWASFFKKHNFLVGLSLDGNYETHNNYRIDIHKKGTLKEILKTVELFQEYHVDFNILTVVTDDIVTSIQEIYAFYKHNNFEYLQFIPCISPYKTEEKTEYLSPLSYGKFLCDLFDLWFNDILNGRFVSIRQFENYLMLLKGYKPESCDMTGHCNLQYIIEANGNVYPCDFYVLDEYLLGNINTNNFQDLRTSPNAYQFLKDGETQHSACSSCQYQFLCRGGCRRYKMRSNSENPHFFCKSFILFFDYALPRLQHLSTLIK